MRSPTLFLLLLSLLFACGQGGMKNLFCREDHDKGCEKFFIPVSGRGDCAAQAANNATVIHEGSYWKNLDVFDVSSKC